MAAEGVIEGLRILSRMSYLLIGCLNSLRGKTIWKLGLVSQEILGVDFWKWQLKKEPERTIAGGGSHNFRGGGRGMVSVVAALACDYTSTSKALDWVSE